MFLNIQKVNVKKFDRYKVIQKSKELISCMHQALSSDTTLAPVSCVAQQSWSLSMQKYTHLKLYMTQLFLF